MIRFARLVVALFLMSPLLAQAREVLADPAPVAIPAGIEGDAVAREIKRALIGRTWTIVAERPGEIDAVLKLRKHVAQVTVRYDSAEVRLAYVSSENLDYKEKRGERYIHGNYLSWVANVMTDVSRNLQLAALD
jgi:hypothetical protein